MVLHLELNFMAQSYTPLSTAGVSNNNIIVTQGSYLSQYEVRASIYIERTDVPMVSHVTLPRMFGI